MVMQANTHTHTQTLIHTEKRVLKTTKTTVPYGVFNRNNMYTSYALNCSYFTFVFVCPDPLSPCEDHEGVLVSEPTSPPHSPADKEDALQTGP